MRDHLHRPVVIFASLLFMVAGHEVQARAWSWAQRLPVNHYSAEDIEIVRPVIREALESGANGQVVEWSNASSGRSGSITPLTDTEQDNRRCRQTRFTSFTQGEQSVSEFFLCRQPDGAWAVEQPQGQ